MNDFPSSFSPMLVKELRQGMRTNLFTVAFILLQAFMMLCLLSGIGNPGSQESDAFFWFFLVTILLVVQPLRGFSALSAEYQLNTMDLIQMTRLDGWRITLGKWTALNAQTLLLITGVLPYLVMRYFLGNVNFVMDLLALGLLSVGSALATSITIGCSVFKNFFVRGILVIAFAIAFSVVFGIFLRSVSGGALDRETLIGTAVAILSSIYGCFFFLTFGASRISPLSENLATRKRLAALIVALLIFAFLPFDSSGPMLAITAFVLGFACIDAITEPLPIFSRVLVPFRKNPLTRCFALFLAPGWISGLGFFVVSFFLWLGGAGIASMLGENLIEDTNSLVAVLSAGNLLLFPLLIIHLFFREGASRDFTFALYTFVQACLFVITMMVSAMASAMYNHEDLIYACVPLPSVLMIAAEDNSADDVYFVTAALVTTFLCFAIPLFRNRASVGSFLLQLSSRN